MSKEFEHRDDDVQPSEVEPTTRDDATPPADHLYLTFDGDNLTFGDRKLMMRDDNE